MSFSDLTLLYLLNEPSLLFFILSSSIYFLVANITVFLALSSNLDWGSLLLRKRRTLGHLIGSIRTIFSYSCLNF